METDLISVYGCRYAFPDAILNANSASVNLHNNITKPSPLYKKIDKSNENSHVFTLVFFLMKVDPNLSAFCW